MRPYAERHDLTPLQLACAWNLEQRPIGCVAPTLIQEPGAEARPIEAKRSELAALAAARASVHLSDGELRAIREIGDNVGSMALKGASVEHEGSPRADRWSPDSGLLALARQWRIDPERDLCRADETVVNKRGADSCGSATW